MTDNVDKSPPIWVVEEDFHGQRIDNFLFTRLKGVPKSRIYRALRNGEFRVNKKRVEANYRLQANDLVRIPPLRVATRTESLPPAQGLLQQFEQAVIYEDKDIIILNKPAGVAVHGGSGINFGVIEAFRHARPKLKFLELVHRLDRDTTGCLILSKKAGVLKELQQLLVEKLMDKQYLALLAGRWQGGERRVNAPLLKNTLSSGERIVRVDMQGKAAETLFKPLKIFGNATLVMVKPQTGRTHQIRVHAASLGHPILGDEKYGDRQASKTLGVKKLLLHAASLEFNITSTKQHIAICACLDPYFLSVIQGLEHSVK